MKNQQRKNKTMKNKSYEELENKLIEIAEELQERFNINKGDLHDILKDRL
jgi:hypothetical protein